MAILVTFAAAVALYTRHLERAVADGVTEDIETILHSLREALAVSREISVADLRSAKFAVLLLGLRATSEAALKRCEEVKTSKSDWRTQLEFFSSLRANTARELAGLGIDPGRIDAASRRR